jgi:shikimate kinase
MKILLLGLSGSGKTTVAKLIAEKFKLKLVEADDKVEEINGGTWPDNDETITKGFRIANDEALLSDNILYVISWLTHKEIKKFVKAGFKIVEMHADFEELVRRKKERDNISPEKIEKFKLTYIEYFNTILNENIKDTYVVSIDSTNLTTQQIADKIIAQHISP